MKRNHKNLLKKAQTKFPNLEISIVEAGRVDQLSNGFGGDFENDEYIAVFSIKDKKNKISKIYPARSSESELRDGLGDFINDSFFRY